MREATADDTSERDTRYAVVQQEEPCNGVVIKRRTVPPRDDAIILTGHRDLVVVGQRHKNNVRNLVRNGLTPRRSSASWS